ncbi:hypothetical protein Bbelb_253590 [Branchiostoma belcheri]|nr:hypothetical protein Bbelb_253590 [Branchiostoma belcheri]
MVPRVRQEPPKFVRMVDFFSAVHSKGGMSGSPAECPGEPLSLVPRSQILRSSEEVVAKSLRVPRTSDSAEAAFLVAMLSSRSVIPTFQNFGKSRTCRGLRFGRSEMATTVLKGDDRSEKRRRPFGKVTTVYETEICRADLL